MKQVCVGGRQVHVSVQRSEKARKTVKVEIKSRDRIVVSIPQDVDVDANAFLEKHRSLLEKKYKQFLTKKPILKEDSILYRGEYHKLVFELVENRPQKDVVASQDTIRIFHESKSNPYRILKKWMTQQAKQYVEEVAQKYSKILGDPLVIRVAETTRWGYIRRNKVIIVNWQVIALPYNLSEYVIVHELVHMSAFNHQKEFHYNLSKIIPDHKKREKALRGYIAIEPKFEYRR